MKNMISFITHVNFSSRRKILKTPPHDAHSTHSIATAKENRGKNLLARVQFNYCSFQHQCTPPATQSFQSYKHNDRTDESKSVDASDMFVTFILTFWWWERASSCHSPCCHTPARRLVKLWSSIWWRDHVGFLQTLSAGWAPVHD